MLGNEKTMRILASIIRYFVPFVAENNNKFWRSMLNCFPLDTYMTPSDLAFAVLVLEHHIMKWRHLLHYKLETGRTPSEEYSSRSLGLLYSGGIAGEEAKRRYNALSVFFFNNFYSPARPGSTQNMSRLQSMVDHAAKIEVASIEKQITQTAADVELANSVGRIQNDILHRVFYYLYV